MAKPPKNAPATSPVAALDAALASTPAPISVSASAQAEIEVAVAMAASPPAPEPDIDEDAIVPASGPWLLLSREVDGDRTICKFAHADGVTRATARLGAESTWVGYAHPNRDATAAWALRLASLAYRFRAETARARGVERHDYPEIQAYDARNGEIVLVGDGAAIVVAGEFDL